MFHDSLLLLVSLYGIPKEEKSVKVHAKSVINYAGNVNLILQLRLIIFHFDAIIKKVKSVFKF